jgi:hypothetical protein
MHVRMRPALRAPIEIVDTASARLITRSPRA